MFSADQIADIQGFNKVYQNLMRQMDSAILEASGLSGGVSRLVENNDGKRFIKRISDMSYIK